MKIMKQVKVYPVYSKLLKKFFDNAYNAMKNETIENESDIEIRVIHLLKNAKSVTNLL